MGFQQFTIYFNVLLLFCHLIMPFNYVFSQLLSLFSFYYLTLFFDLIDSDGMFSALLLFIY